MTKKLEETFNLTPVELTPDEAKQLADEMAQLEQLDKQVPTITDLSTSDREMDELAKKAIDSFDDLMSLGMNVEQRFAAPIFDAASKMLGHAVLAKTAKMDKKLKAIDLELKRMRLLKDQNKDTDEPIEGEARTLDRNELLKMLRGQ